MTNRGQPFSRSRAVLDSTRCWHRIWICICWTKTPKRPLIFRSWTLTIGRLIRVIRPWASTLRKPPISTWWDRQLSSKHRETSLPSQLVDIKSPSPLRRWSSRSHRHHRASRPKRMVNLVRSTCHTCLSNKCRCRGQIVSRLEATTLTMRIFWISLS